MRYGNTTQYNGGTAARIALAAIVALLALMLLAAPPAGAQTLTDYDTDDDRLIEVRNWAQLHAIRYDLNGNGDATDAEYVAAFPGRDTNAQTRMGCPSGMACQGYELMADLDFDFNGDGTVNAADFDTDGSGTTDSNDADNIYWNGGSGWRPLGHNATVTPPRYTARFHGNGHVISNLFINAGTSYPASTHQGLFAYLDGGARVEYLGLENANVSGHSDVAILAGQSRGAIYGVYVTGQASSLQRVGGIIGTMRGAASVRASYSRASASADSGMAGGLVARIYNNGSITASYSAGSAHSASSGGIGGLVGRLETVDIRITASYSASRVSGVGNKGGLVGRTNRINSGSVVVDSYCDAQAAGENCFSDEVPNSGIVVPNYTTRQLKRPTGYTGIYEDWNVNVLGDSAPDDPWDFGTHRNYPLLKVDFDGDGTATCEEFGRQPCYREPGPPPYNPAHDHPEIYQNPRHEMTASCAVQTTGTGDDAVTTSTLTFDLGAYTRPITLVLSLWDGDVFRTLQSQGISMPELRQEGQTAKVEVVTDPAKTRFRIDSQYGLNLVLGYADCHTDDP